MRELEELFRSLDGDLVLTEPRVYEDRIELHAKMGREEAVCPYCGAASKSVHTIYPAFPEIITRVISRYF